MTKPSQVPVFVNCFNGTQPTHSLKYSLWPLSEIWPKNPKYLLSSLLQKSPPTAALHHQPHSTIIQYLPNSHTVSDNLYNYCLRFFSPANQSASDLYTGFCYSSFNDLGSVFIPGLTILHSALRTCTQIIMVYILMLDILSIANSFIYFTPSC